MGASPSVAWFRNDLRLGDNPALRAAVERGGPVIPIFIWAPEEEGDWPPGAASRWWLHQSLKQLAAELKQLGTPLVLRRGSSADVLREIVGKTVAAAVFWNRRYEPAVLKRDKEIAQELRTRGCEVEIFNGNLLTDPESVRNKSGKPFQVFTAFWKACLSTLEPGAPLAKPRELIGLKDSLKSEPLSSFELEPKIDWAGGLRKAWEPGETGATKNLRQFCSGTFRHYRIDRDRPDLKGTSRLSPHLHFGEITPRQVCHLLQASGAKAGLKNGAWKQSQFVTELGWREFAHHLLCSFPHTPSEPLRKEFERFPWRKDAARLKAWHRGLTGYPIVDAGMRELWTTGWMHNRVRMIVASFLVKDLFISWQQGAHWFWDTLVDADLANNTLGWQWTAGCGADAAPFFRIFNPVNQGQKFDPKGDYIRRWVPELAKLPAPWIYEPWHAPRELLEKMGIELSRTYSTPIVDHGVAREKALEGFAKIKGKR